MAHSSTRHAAVCDNGHFICFCDGQASVPNYCSSCRAVVSQKCFSCQAPIFVTHIHDRKPPVDIKQLPNYCPNCGAAFPWLRSALEAAKQILLMDDRLSAEQKNQMESLLPDVVSETSKTPLAIRVLSSVLKTAETESVKQLVKIVFDFGCDLVKKMPDLRPFQ